MRLLMIIFTQVFHFIKETVFTGVLSSLSWITTCFCLKSPHRNRRLGIYDLNAEGSPEKLGFIAPPEEWKFESPQESNLLNQNLDGVFCMGVNSKSEILAVRIFRQGDGKVHCSLTLRLCNGCTYSLDEAQSVQSETVEPHAFGSSRMKMVCLLPMRKWRIFFNGTLRETSGNDENFTERSCHVRFSFIWTASSDVFDYTCDMSQEPQAKMECESLSSRSKTKGSVKRLKDLFGGYEQCGMFSGTVNVEDQPENEIYLWGNRIHFMGQDVTMQECRMSDGFINAENGTFMHLGLLTIPGYIKDFPYGYVMKANGFVYPVKEYSITNDNGLMDDKINLSCTSGGVKYVVNMIKQNFGQNFTEAFGENVELYPVIGRLNSMEVWGLFSESTISAKAGQIHPNVFCSSPQEPLIPEMVPYSIPFGHPNCQELSVSGGKGASLAKLSVISEELKTFTVPKGVVVTTIAYNQFTEGLLDETLKKLQDAAWNHNPVPAEITSASASVMKVLIETKISKSMAKSIEKNIYEVFGKDINEKRFAVRSSAMGEDTEQMSAAGQMETFLGCNGIAEIFEATKKCWASQFSFVAVEYKRRYGQLLNIPMAVVVQEMVPCDVAGVAFSCDPVTGNPAFISITANYGLGESVVSASAEPDTVTLKKYSSHKLKIHSKSTGIKQTKIIMDDSHGVKEVKIDDEESSMYSIDDNFALALGEVIVKIEEKFVSPRDIEWGGLNGEIYLFQARPVTSIDVESDFEIKHIFDSYRRREDEYLTTANIGEVMPAASSILGLDYINSLLRVTFARMKYTKWEGEDMPTTPYFEKRIARAYNHGFINLADGFFKFSETETEVSDFTKALTVSILGRVLDDKKISQIAIDRHKTAKKPGLSLISFIHTTLYMFFGKYFTKLVSNQWENFRIPIKKNQTAWEIFCNIGKHFDCPYVAMTNHVDCSCTSPFWNLSLLTLLSKAKGVWDNDVYRDYGYLLSSIKQVLSADVPSAIQTLGRTVSRSIDPGEFKKMNEKEALNWLLTTSTDAGKKFRDFLTRHGHRCYKEFDVYSNTWAMDPKTLVKILQGMASNSSEDLPEKKSESFNDIISKMLIKLTFLQRLKLRLLLPHCHRGVREREVAKSLTINMLNKVRIAFHELADALVHEGRIPKRDLMFFLTAEEIHQLIKTRSPKLVSSAFRRWKCHPELDKLIFPETSSGIPRPVNMDDDLNLGDLGAGFSMTGVPVSQGVVKGRARVVMNIEDAPSIEEGDILITYSTDIAWSPYFPLLSGVVTELGGLISHGAVVAREYGLPCVVHLHGATRAFKSGDIVLLDGNRGVLQKIEES